MNRVIVLAATFLIACLGKDGPTPTGPEESSDTGLDLEGAEEQAIEEAVEMAEEEPELPPPCSVGQEIGPGESCLVGDDDIFEAMDDGTGCFKIYRDDGESWRCRGDEVDEEGFKALRINDTDTWRIEEVP